MSRIHFHRATRYGICEETEPTRQLLSQRGRRESVIVEQSQLTWRPSPELADDVPTDLQIQFNVYRGPDGLRRFIPAEGYGVFIQQAWLAGLAVLRRHRDPANDVVFTYRFMKLVFDRVRAGREHLDRRFTASRDLYVRRTGRGGGIQASLLPDYVGRTADGGGHSWSIRELTQRGRAAAADAGFANPTNDRAIAYGLMHAAEINPSPPLERDEAQHRIFTALFEPGDGFVAVDDAMRDDVIERLRVAVEEHADEAWPRFEAWFSGCNNNLVQSLARKSGFTRLPREVVKSALLRLGLRSYEYVSGCLSLFGQALRSGLDPALDEEERRIFDAMYLPQDCYGGLPLLLLLERGATIGLAVARLWETPHDRRLIGTLHRLLQIYADLAPARRAADRRFGELGSALRQARNNHAEARSDRSGNHRDLRDLQSAVRRLLRVQEQSCPQCLDNAEPVIECELSRDGSVVVFLTCERHRFSRECQFTVEQVTAAVADIDERAG